ncbi:MAG: hypothetical protein ACXV7G_10420 [Halobacteriota archaeon]
MKPAIATVVFLPAVELGFGEGDGDEDGDGEAVLDGGGLRFIVHPAIDNDAATTTAIMTTTVSFFIMPYLFLYRVFWNASRVETSELLKRSLFVSVRRERFRYLRGGSDRGRESLGFVRGRS